MEMFFKPSEAAKFLGVSIRTIKSMKKDGRIVPDIVDSTGHFFYSQAQLLRIKNGANVQNGAKTVQIENAENISENTPDISELCTQLKQIHYSELVTHGILHRAKKSGFTCPFCGNGDGDSGTGIEEFIQNGIVTSHCPKCSVGDKIDNIKILAHYYNLDSKSDFREVVIQGARELLNITFDNNSDSDFLDLKAIRDLILKDIADSQQNLSAFLDTRGGNWRGLTFDTLYFFRIGFLPQWSHPKNIVAGKKIFYSPRIIIQTGEQNYNAILLNEDRHKFQKKSWKLNAGNKKIFGLDLLPDNSDFIVFVEGEVDAMSIYQATEGKVFALAILVALTFPLNAGMTCSITSKPRINLEF